jgi:hypothetical protein
MGVTPAGRGIQMLGVYSTFVALTTIAVTLRVYCRSIIVKKFGVDDYLAVASWVYLLTATQKANADVDRPSSSSLRHSP